MNTGKSLVISLLLFHLLLMMTLHCSIVSNRPMKKKSHDKLLAEMFPSFFSGSFKIDALYSCVGRQKNDPPRCCSCDQKCFLRKDCCIDVHFLRMQMPPDIYIEYFVAKRQDTYSNGSCVPVVGNKSVLKANSVQYVYAKRTCSDGRACFDDYGHLVVGRNGNFYINQLCAKCNQQEKYRFPRLSFEVCSGSYNKQFSSKTLPDLSNLTQYTIKTLEKTAIDCPYGALTRPDRPYSKCTQFEYELCLSYVAVVSDARGGYAANPHCIKCLPYHAKPLVDVEQCDSIRSPRRCPTTTNSTTQVIMKAYSRTVRVGDGKTLGFCTEGTFFDTISMSCQPEDFFVNFLVSPLTTPAPIENAVTSANAIPDISFGEFLVGFYRFLNVWYSLCLALGTVSILLVILTYSTIKGLQHPPGKWLLGISIVLLIDFCLQFVCTFHRPSAEKTSLYIPGLIHWCVLTKYLFMAMLTYEFCVANLGKQHTTHNVVSRIILTCIASMTTIIIFGWNNDVTQYGGCLVVSFVGRVYVYWLPIVFVGSATLVALCTLKRKIKRQRNENLNDRDVTLLLKAIECSVKYLIFALVVDTLVVIYFETERGVDRKLLYLINSSFKLVYCTLNGLQGVLVLFLFVKRKFIVMIYRWRVRTFLGALEDWCCCDFCFEYVEEYDSDDEDNDNGNVTQETIALSTRV